MADATTAATLGLHTTSTNADPRVTSGRNGPEHMNGVDMATLRPGTPQDIGAVARGGSVSATAAKPLTMERSFAGWVWAIARLSMGWIFLWAFLDKTFGLGHETPSAKAWTNGGNPTKGFLSGAVGPFDGFYHDIAGNGVVNWLFMLTLLGLGVALILGVAMRPACAIGAVLVVLMWSASLPPANNPFMDDHIIYALLLVGLAATHAGNTLGLGRLWERLAFVQRHRWLA